MDMQIIKFFKELWVVLIETKRKKEVDEDYITTRMDYKDWTLENETFYRIC